MKRIMKIPQIIILVLSIKKLMKLIILKISIEMHLAMKTRKVVVTLIILVKRVLMNKLPITLLL